MPREPEALRRRDRRWAPGRRSGGLQSLPPGPNRTHPRGRRGLRDDRLGSERDHRRRRQPPAPGHGLPPPDRLPVSASDEHGLTRRISRFVVLSKCLRMPAAKPPRGQRAGRAALSSRQNHYMGRAGPPCRVSSGCGGLAAVATNGCHAALPRRHSHPGRHFASRVRVTTPEHAEITAVVSPQLQSSEPLVWLAAARSGPHPRLARRAGHDVRAPSRADEVDKAPREPAVHSQATTRSSGLVSTSSDPGASQCS